MNSENDLLYIVSRIVDNANDALEESEQNVDDDFYKGKLMAYYEVLDTIKSELISRDYDISEIGLDVELEQKFL